MSEPISKANHVIGLFFVIDDRYKVGRKGIRSECNHLLRCFLVLIEIESLSSRKTLGLFMRLLLLSAPSRLVRTFCERDCEVISINSPKSFNAHDTLPEAWAPRQRSYELLGREKVNWKCILKIRNIAKEFRPDIIHAFLPKALAWSVLGTIGLKHPSKIISYRGIERVPWRFDPSERITYFSPRVSFHACESQAVRDAMVRGGIDPNKCNVVYNCAPVKVERQSPMEWRKEWGLTEDHFVIGSVGHIRPVKGVDILLEAVRLCRDIPLLKVVLIGQLDDARVKELVRSDELRERVILTGPTPYAANAMNAFDLFVMASRQEGLCRALIEAMEQGVCPVVSTAGGMKELVRHNIDGKVFESQNSASLAEAIRTLHRDSVLLRQMAQSSKIRAREVCSPSAFCDRLLSIYRGALRLERRIAG